MSNSVCNQSMIDLSMLGDESCQLTEKRLDIIGDILELYQCRPQTKLYRHFHSEAKFEDPLVDARNLTEIMAQFNAMPKVFPNSQTKRCKIILNKSDELQIDLTQAYTLVGLGNVIELSSLVVIKLDEEDRVVGWEDRWDHKAGWKDEGLLSPVTNFLRRLNAQVLPNFISTD